MKYRRKALLSVVLVAAVGGGLMSCAPEPPEPEPTQLTLSEAGGMYLDAVCPVNEAWDAADVVIDQLRIAVARGEGDVASFAVAMEEVAQASETAAEVLDTEHQVWPGDSVASLTTVRDQLLRDTEQVAEIQELSAAEVAAYSWDAGDGAQASANVREALELPASAEVACEEWAALQ